MAEKRKLIVNEVKKNDHEYKEGKTNQKKWLWRELVTISNITLEHFKKENKEFYKTENYHYTQGFQMNCV